jgi:adenylate cyclase
VPEEVVEELAAHPEKVTLGGEHREVTLMFTDLAGFTTMAEQLEPTRAAEALNRYMTEMNRVIFRHQGTIIQFIGDAIMAFWNAPLADPDHARKAVRAARDMQAAMDGLNAQLAADGLPPLGMRIGVHTGMVLVGNMGSAIGRLYYTALGDSVNLASRLEGANKAYGTNILVSAATVEKLGGEIPMRRVDLVKVKGKHKAVEVLTPCEDKRLAETSDAAVLAFRKAQWDASEALWREVLGFAPQDSVAAVYLQRIEAMHSAPPPGDWDGSMALDSK